MPQFGGKDSKRHFTVVMGNKEHGLYISSTPSSAAKKAVTKLCTANKSKKVEFSIREITQGSKKKTYGPYEGYIEKLKEPIELKGRVIKYKPVAKLVKKNGAKIAVKKGGIRGGWGVNMSNKKGGMNRTGASASSASSNDSKKRIYPHNLHEVKSTEELLSLNAWVNFVKEERKDFMQKKQSGFYATKTNYGNHNQDALNNANEQGYTSRNRESFKKLAIGELKKKFENIPLKDENLIFLINFIIGNPHDGLGPYEDDSYFEDITNYVVQMKKDHPKWEPNIQSCTRSDFENWHNI